MAHKVETMAYNERETPWHGLGNPVGDLISVDEMVHAAGLDWPVDTAPVDYRVTIDGTRSWNRVPKQHVLYRGDTGEALDIVGNRYTPTQNHEVLEFFREYVEAGEATLETAGSLDHGKYVWGLARLHRSFNLGNGEKDEVLAYVLLMNPHQYGKGMILKMTDVRVVCWNTATRALKDGNPDIRLWHNRKFDERAREEAKRRLGIARDQFDAAEKEARVMASTGLTERQVIRVLTGVFDPKADPEKTGPEDLNPRPRRIFDLFNGEGMGSRLSTAEGTAWGLYNAVTEYVDHEMGRGDREARLMVSWLGRGERFKRKAKESLLVEAGLSTN